MLKKQGVTWDGVPVPEEKIENLDQTAIQLFKKKALESHRLDSKALSMSDEILFQNLGLTDGKYLKRQYCYLRKIRKYGYRARTLR